MEQLEVEQVAGNSADVTVFRLTGPFTLATLFSFQATLRDPALKSVIIDLSGVPYMDSAALGSLMGLHVSCQQHGRRYALVGASHRLHMVFRVSGVDALLVSYPTLAEAEAALGGKAASV